MKANTVVFTSHAGIKTVDVAEALVTQGYTDVASVQITNSNLTKVTLLSATQTDALLGHGFFIGDSHFSVRPAFTKQLQLHIFDVPIWIENTVICSALAAFGQIQGDIRHGQIQTPSGITVGTGMRFATIELKEGCRQVPSFVRTADQHQFRVRHEDQRATCRICMGEHFARSCPSKRPTNKPPTNTQSTSSAALPGSQLSSGTSAPDAGGSEAVVSASSGSSCTNTDPSAEPESSNQSTSSARTRTEPKGSHSYASAAQQGARAQFNCTHGAAEQVSTAPVPDGSPASLEKRSCQLFYYCVHMAEKTTSLCYVSFYVRCSVFHLGYVSLYVRCSVLDLPTRGSRVLCTCTADIVFSACSLVRGSVFGCACARNFLLWNCFLHELFRIFRLLAWLISFRRC